MAGWSNFRALTITFFNFFIEKSRAETNYQGIKAMEAQKTRLDELVKKHRLSQIDVFRLVQQGALDAQKQT